MTKAVETGTHLTLDWEKTGDAFEKAYDAFEAHRAAHLDVTMHADGTASYTPNTAALAVVKRCYALAFLAGDRSMPPKRPGK